METRIAKLESHVERIQSDIHEMKQDIREIKVDARADFRILFGSLIAVAIGLAALMARGFGWIH